MRKYLFVAVAAMMATVSISVSGQNIYADSKHEVGISSGFPSTSHIADLVRVINDVGRDDGVMYDASNLHSFTLEYFYRVKEWLGVGGMLIYGTGNPVATEIADGTPISEIKNGAKIAEMKNHYVSLMPTVKFDWIRRQYFGMYSKVGLGFTSRHEQTLYSHYTRSNEQASFLHLNGHLTLVGMDFGSPHFRGFFDLGFGEQGIILLGLRYKI